ncbi:hypothetical protein D7V83_19460 [bacterium 0.1xD8-71]|jgi:hypothetical protein|nr:hypothetical protein [Lachnospiraceae bacterium]NDO51396.1 hypothetical protein [Lachnospiraceae bacterium MD335]RKI76667.1 hypothetical protein D7V83_19460 [bacterium 0.1xD8-71]
MKKYLTIILATLFTMSVFTGCARRSSSPEQSNVSTTNSPITTSEPGEMPDNSFSKEEYQKLLALQLDGYEDMTVSDYRNHIAKLTDTAEYRDLLERFWKSQILYGVKDTDGTASFLFYVLPLAGDEWETQNFSEEVRTSNTADNTRLEYSFSLTILDADTLTIREYNATRLNVIKGMQDILGDKTVEELQNTNSILADIQSDTDNLIKQLETEKMEISIEYAYFPAPIQGIDKENSQSQEGSEQETREYSNGTEEDYRSLLTLKTPDYQNTPIKDFNTSLLAWANENRERMERIDEDTKFNDFSVTLTAEELSFVKLTVFLSGMENGKAIQSSYAETELNPYYGEYLPEKITSGSLDVARCSLYYQFSYRISETETVTVGERDRQIENMINAVQTFWGDMDVESALKMNENDIAKKLEEIAAIYTTDHITITINKEQIHFERMDERAYRN